MSSLTPVSSCRHSTDLFGSPLCDKQSLIRKIVNVVFHVLTLGVPLALYKIYNCVFPRQAVDETQIEIIRTTVNHTHQKTDEEKKEMISKLQNWFSDNLPTEFLKGILEIQIPDSQECYWYDDYISNIKEALSTKTGIAVLQNLTVPTDDPKLAFVVKRIISSAWTNALRAPEIEPYCKKNNAGEMTYDSASRLHYALYLEIDRIKEHNIVNSNAVTAVDFWKKELENYNL